MPITSAAFQILLALAESARHGLGILDEVEARTGRALAIGTLYRSLKQLTDDGLIEATHDGPAESADPRRRYYRLTTHGRHVMRADARRALQLADWVKAIGVAGTGRR
jgi:DNA-binding PadR family transcriptional regulator